MARHMKTMAGEIAYDGDDVCPVCGTKVGYDEHVSLEFWGDGSVSVYLTCPSCGSEYDHVYVYGHTSIGTDGRYKED